MRRLIRMLTVVALVATPAVALAAGSTGQVWVTNCTKEQYRPAGIVLACADGYTYLSGLKWSSWTASSASGRGTEYANNCSPNCLKGHFHKYAVSVALSKPKSCSHQKHQVFNQLELTFTGTRPSNTPRTEKLTLGCPY